MSTDQEIAENILRLTVESHMPRRGNPLWTLRAICDMIGESEEWYNRIWDIMWSLRSQWPYYIPKREDK